MEKLISMTDFVLDQQNKSDSMGNSFWKCTRYANFLKQPLTLGMFVPCDLDGNVLEEPEHYSDYLLPTEEYVNIVSIHSNEWHSACEEYQEAKSRVLFEGYEIARSVKAVIIVSNGIPIHFCSETKRIKFEKENYTIQDLFRRNDSLGYELFLTESVKQKIGL